MSTSCGMIRRKWAGFSLPHSAGVKLGLASPKRTPQQHLLPWFTWHLPIDLTYINAHCIRRHSFMSGFLGTWLLPTHFSICFFINFCNFHLFLTSNYLNGWFHFELIVLLLILLLNGTIFTFRSLALHIPTSYTWLKASTENHSVMPSFTFLPYLALDKG